MTMTEDEIRKDVKNGRYFREIDWLEFSGYTNLSEEFIREFSEYVEWNVISYNQKLSYKFIKEFSNRINWFNISYRKKVSEKFIKEFLNEVHRLKWVPMCFFKIKHERYWKTFL